MLVSCGVGLISVSIANWFWGYYGIGFAIFSVLFTMYCLEILNLKLFNENKIDFSLMLGGLFFQFLFFVVNDIFSVPVYKKNYFNFWSVVVLFSQVYSCGVIVYVMVKSVFYNFTKKNVEVIEKINLENDKKIETDLRSEIDLSINNDYVEPLKMIPNSNIKTKTFEEEEIK